MKTNLDLLGDTVRKGLFAAVAFSLAATPFTVLAQDEVTEEDEVTVTEEVLVTGSRIKRIDNLSSPVPMVSLGEDQIEFTGSVNVYDILNELPQSGEGLTRGNTNFTVGSSGVQSINLRGLGSSRTLVLVNGRRWVGGQPGTGIVDLNSIPADLIERLEVITGGASSVYGSDAVAGVVNVILKKDYSGIDIEAMNGAYSEGDGRTNSFSVTMGGNFADGRGNAMFNVRRDEQGDLMARDRAPYTGRDIFYLGYFLGGGSDAVVDPGYSSYPPQGRFFVSGSTGDSTGMLTFSCANRDEDSVLPSTEVVPWGGSTACGFNRTWHRRLEVPLDRYSAFGSATYEINDDHEGFFEMSFTSVDSEAELEPIPFISEDIFGGIGTRGYHYTNPFVPAEIAAAAVAANADNPDWNGEIPFIRRMQEFGNRGASNTRETFRAALGMQGSFGDIDYDWYYQYGRTDRTQTGVQYNAPNFQNALRATTDALGNVICADEVARAAGCVPINVFGMGAITPEAAAYVSAQGIRTSFNEQHVVGLNITSNFELWDRNVGWAVGAEYRKEEADDFPDALQQAGLHGGNVVPRTRGDYDVTGIYAEMVFPLITDVPGIQDLSLETAYRVDDYSSAGSVDATKLGLNWTINDQFRVRGVVADSVRAPDIDDLFAGQAQTYVPITDPCAGLGTADEASMDSVVVANCYAIPDVAATAASGSFNPDTGQFEPGFFYSQPDIQTISGFVGGNPNLSEESADTTTIGMIWTPDFADLALSLDWYDIEIDSVISSISAQRLINECFSTPGLSDFQCDAHQRFPGTGKLRYWYSFGINQSLLKSSGYDVAASYRLPELGFMPGSLRLSMLWTHRDEHVSQTTVDSSPSDSVGEVGYNDDKVKFTLVWEHEKWLVSLDNTWYSDSLDDSDYPADDYHLQQLKSIFYTDIQVRYFPSENWQLYVGLDNAFNEQPPYCPGCTNEPSPGSHYSGSQYRPWDSQFWYFGAKYSWGKD